MLCSPEKAMATHSSTLAWKIAWTEEPGGLQSMGSRLSDFTFTFHFLALEKEMATYSSVLAWRIPGRAEPNGLRSMGSHRVQHDWSDLAAAAAAACCVLNNFFFWWQPSSTHAENQYSISCYVLSLSSPKLSKINSLGYLPSASFFLDHCNSISKSSFSRPTELTECKSDHQNPKLKNLRWPAHL